MVLSAREMTLATMLARNARIYAGRTALVCRGVSLCYPALDSGASRLAADLKRHGVQRGTRVAALLRNCHQYIELLFALSRMGAVLVPLNWRLAASEQLYILRESDSMVLVHGGDFAGSIEALRGAPGAEAKIVDLSGLEAASGNQGAAVADPAVDVGHDDVAVQMYTGAFEGRPRGAQITHGGYLAEAASVALALSMTDADATLITVPLFHTFGLELAISVLARGGKCVFADPFDAAEVLRIIERERLTVLVCAGQHLAEVLKESEVNRADVSSLRLIMGSGASKEMRGLVRAMAPGARFVDAVYGQTECGAMVTGCDTEDAESIGPRCVGRPLMFQDVRVFDPDGAEVAAGHVGEIVVRGPRVMAGYYKALNDHRESPGGGWRHTGDLGLLDELGYLHYMGRSRELIKSGMENVYPVEVEIVLAAHPAVREAAVIGVPDGQWGEAVTAIVALKEGTSATGEELIQFCKERIASYKKPKRVHFVDELPRGEGGQIARREIRDRFGGR